MKHTLFFGFILHYILACSLGVAQESLTHFKDQKHSSIKWGELDLARFTSFKEWKEQSDNQDKVPDWEQVLRERNNREIVGRFFQCVGTCRVDRGQSFFNPHFSSALYEGDEIETLGESYAWLFLLDGTMVRLSPDSSINLNELNIGVQENFLNARVNTGNVLWLSRHELLFAEENIRETEVLFNPLALYEAQPVPDRKNYHEGALIELIEEKETVLNQYKNLNKLVEENNKWMRAKPTYVFLVTPNLTLMGINPSVEIVSLLGGKTYVKKRSWSALGLAGDKADEEISLQLRGFENKELTPLVLDQWMSVDEKGRELSTVMDEPLHWLIMGELITKRIPSLMVARELLLQKYSDFAFREKYDALKLASLSGYRLWGPLKSIEDKKSDFVSRIDFLKEYTRRIETTNLLSSAHFRERLKERGEFLKSMEYGNYFFIKALNAYYSYEDYTDEKEMGDVLNSTTKLLWKRMHGIK